MITELSIISRGFISRYAEVFISMSLSRE